MPALPNQPRAILLFDGVCSLCHGAVRFVAARDDAGRFVFVSLQSELGQRLLRAHGVPAVGLDTVVLLGADGRAYLRSDAVLRVLRGLRAPWPLAGAALVLPRVLRDAVYRVIARHRRRWPARPDACAVATPAQRKRFLA